MFASRISTTPSRSKKPTAAAYYLLYNCGVQKIPSLFVRNYAGDRKVLDQVVPGSEWVVQGEGVATRKWDGVAVLVRHGNVFKRFDAKAGRTPPPNFEPLQTAPDANTGHWPGWVPAKLPDDRWILEGIAWGVAHRYPQGVPDGTYEVCGPRIGTRHGANPENLQDHILVPHGEDTLDDCPRTYDGIRAYLANRSIEGVVWHHPDGRRVKIKKADFP